MPSACSAPKTPQERRERRREVEAALLRGESMQTIHATLGPRYRVSPRTLRSDRRRIEDRWAREDAPGLAGMQAAALRRLERLTDRLESEGDLRGAVTATGLLGRFLGLGGAGPVAVARVGIHPINSLGELLDRVGTEAEPPRLVPREWLTDPRLRDAVLTLTERVVEGDAER